MLSQEWERQVAYTSSKNLAGYRSESDARRQRWIGFSLAAAVVAGWIGLHIAGVFFFDWTIPGAIPLAALLMGVQCWLSVGLFIVAHDCMHGSLVPLHPIWNRRIGQLCLGLYACFSFDAVNRKHHLHHRNAGTSEDPDFQEDLRNEFWSWYAKFFREYFTGWEFVRIGAVCTIYLLVLGGQVLNVFMFWVVPAIASSVQLFTFGTYLPHRRDGLAFADRHNARSNDYPWLLSLLTCFHFGYHHEHHLRPGIPWWRLPSARGSIADRQPNSTREVSD
jgi:beta-carotene ketolase (CrtW type)